jgi:hypothetical protein
MKVSKIKSISLERKRIYKLNEIEHVAGYGNGGVICYRFSIGGRGK